MLACLLDINAYIQCIIKLSICNQIYSKVITYAYRCFARLCDLLKHLFIGRVIPHKISEGNPSMRSWCYILTFSGCTAPKMVSIYIYIDV